MKYPEAIAIGLSSLKNSLSKEDYDLVEMWTRHVAMLDLPAPRLAIVRWFCNTFNLVEEWYKWEQAGRLASLKLELPERLQEKVLAILERASNNKE